MQMTFKFGLGDKVRVIDALGSVNIKSVIWEVYAIHVTQDGTFYELIHSDGYVTLSEDSLEKI